MARQVIVSLADDLDGSDAESTVTFGLDNRMYEIDLNGEHEKELREYLARFTAVARPAQVTAPAKRIRNRNRVDTQAIREWAKANGLRVNDRGRIPVEIVAQYQAGNAAGS